MGSLYTAPRPPALLSSAANAAGNGGAHRARQPHKGQAGGQIRRGKHLHGIGVGRNLVHAVNRTHRNRPASSSTSPSVRLDALLRKNQAMEPATEASAQISTMGRYFPVLAA